MNKRYTFRELVEAQLRGEIVEYRRLSEERWLEHKMLVSCSMSEIDEEVSGLRIKPTTKPSIDWDHVHPRYNYLARYKNGVVCLFEECPTKIDTTWRSSGGDVCRAISHSSLTVGNCDWEDSLIQRPTK